MIVSNGCSIVGYTYGKNSDVKNANTYKNVEFEEINQGDFVDIWLEDEIVIRGEVVFINLNKNIGVYDVDALYETEEKVKVYVYELDKINEIMVLDIKQKNRSAGFTFGLILDVLLMALLV